jgi:hypothetical protein
MTREEYATLRRCKSSVRKAAEKNEHSMMASIPVNASVDFKERLDKVYREYGWFPCGSVRVHEMLDDKERIIYLHYGDAQEWQKLTTVQERDRAYDALRRKPTA